MYYHFPDIIYHDIKELSVAYINLINPSKDTMKDLLQEERNIKDTYRSIKKSKNHFDLGPVFTELAKEGYPQGNLSLYMLSDIAKNHKFKLEPDSKCIKEVYETLLK